MDVLYFFIDELREYMEKYGAVLKCTLKKDQETNRSRGFGFVVFEDPSSIDRVCIVVNTQIKFCIIFYSKIVNL